jgi:ABC-type uncharacterized transport system involved in gliding motility auxiliary subunit
MDRSFRSGLILLAGIALIATAMALRALLVESAVPVAVVGFAGIALAAWGAYALRSDLRWLVKQRRGEIALYTVGLVGILIALAYFSTRFPARVDMTEAELYSLSPQTVNMLQRLEKPVHITFFHDRMMRETAELYALMARQTDKVTVEFFDPMMNPAQARMRGVEFAGTAILQSEARELRVNGPTETDIANAILRVSQAAQQKVCFLDGHGEADPFSLEQHDHTEGDVGHKHGIGQKMVTHERHGIAKARHGLEAMNYVVEKVALMQGNASLTDCAVLVVAGPKTSLLAAEVKAIDEFLERGGNALFMLDPFISTGLEPVIRKLGVVLDNNIVIDEASHFWADMSAPAVTDYNRHEITDNLPLTFFPGARSLSPTPQRVPGTSVRPLVNTSKRSYGSTSLERIDFDPARDQTGPLTLMALVIRNPGFVDSASAIMRELQGGPAAEKSVEKAPAADAPKAVSRIVVAGDADFATNSFYHILGNGSLFINAVNYLSAREDLIGIKPRTYDLPYVNLTNRQMKGTFFLSIILVPLLMAFLGIAVWWRQR